MILHVMSVYHIMYQPIVYSTPICCKCGCYVFDLRMDPSNSNMLQEVCGANLRSFCPKVMRILPVSVRMDFLVLVFPGAK